MNKIAKFIADLKQFEDEASLIIQNEKMKKALEYFSSPEVYERFTVNGIELEAPVLVNGLTIATEALKDDGDQSEQ